MTKMPLGICAVFLITCLAMGFIYLNRPIPKVEHIGNLSQLAASTPVQIMTPVSVATVQQSQPKAAVSNGPQPGQPWTNSLGVRFVPAGTDGVLFSVYDVRLKDFQRFAKETNLAVSSEHMYAFKVKPNGQTGYYTTVSEPDSTLSWQDPGFTQGPTDPVVGMSWNEAQLFCQWLTDKERSEGLIGSNQSYRLPTTAEWNKAAGDSVYPWGDTWPPSEDSGNYQDQSWARSSPGQGWDCLPEDDGYARTSPVGKFRPNQFGLYDMGGNVWQLSNDADPQIPVHKLWRGASWSERSQRSLRSDSHQSCGPTYRYNSLGFRVVLEIK